MRLNSYPTVLGHTLLHQPDLSLAFVLLAGRKSVRVNNISFQTLTPLLSSDPAQAAVALNALCELAEPRAEVWNHLSSLADVLYDEDSHDSSFVYRSSRDREPVPLFTLLDDQLEAECLCSRDSTCAGKHSWILARHEGKAFVWHVNRDDGSVVPPEPLEVY